MNTIVIEAKQCPNCGKLMAAGALAGLCPACLLAQGGLDSQAGQEQKAPFVPPPLDEIRRLFPQLEIVSLLGAGGMGAVYKARQPALDRWVALKVLPASNSGGVNFTERFNREARALARLNHPNIVTVHEFGQADTLHYFIMEFVDGTNLRQLERGARLSSREALQIIPQICDALQYAHDEGVVHRDIKPENVLIDRKGRVKIADFGLAKILGTNPEAHRLTMEGQVMGTPHYMAPEQIEKPLAVDHRADIYSLGVVLYEMLTGDLPLGKFSPPSRKVEVDVRLDEVVLRALENDPERRYQQASEVKSRVETIATTSAPIAPVPPEKVARWMGVPLVSEADGARRIIKSGVLKLLGLAFGVLTIALLTVSIAAGKNLFGWIGIVGGSSLLARLLLSALVAAVGTWIAWRRPVSEVTPLRGDGEPIFSRKALVAACWAPMFFIAALLFFVIHADQRNESSSVEAWQWLLVTTVLPLGLAAPFGVTILGWLAVGDIRCSGGRITGLPLAVFDGLLFPLLAVNALLASVWMYSVRALAQGLGNHGFTGTWPAIGSLGALLICAVATIDISRRVWRAVRSDVNTPPRRISPRGRIAIGVAGALAIVVGMLLIEVVYKQQSKTRPGGVPSSFQVAETDPVTGALVARLPRGEVSLLAVSDEKAAPNQWWFPDGTPVTNALFEVSGVPEASGNAQLVRDFVFQVRDLPSGASGPEFKVLPTGGAGSGGEVRMNGDHLRYARPARIYFQQDVEQATVRLGFGLEEWRTIVVHEPLRHSVRSETRAGDPRWSVHFHNVNDSPDGVQATFLAARFKHEWSMRLVAVDTNGVEHTYSRASGTPSEENATWTYTFRKLTLAATKELRVQVRPLHWVEFRDVALEPKDRSALGKGTLPFKPTRFSEVREVRITGPFDFDTGKMVVATDAMRAMSQSSFLKSPLAREMGVDAAAGSSELRLVEMAIADLAPSEWERQRPETLSERLNRSQYGPPRLPSGREIPLPLAYAFRTREGTLGMVQLLGVAEGEVFLRYKIVEPARFE